MNRFLRHRYFLTAALIVLFAPPKPAPAIELGLQLDPNSYHLGKAGEPEWSEFAGKTPHGPELNLEFNSTANEIEYSLFIRQENVKYQWTVELNGKSLGRLVPMEWPLIHSLPVPAGALRDGLNTLRVSPPQQIDDVIIGPITLAPASFPEVLNQSILEIEVLDEQAGEPIPSRITLATPDGVLIPVTGLPGPSDPSPAFPSPEQLAVRPGVVYTPNGKARLGVPPGHYTIYASRGFEYGVDEQRISVGSGQTKRLQLRITREVPTPGWVSSDTHTHTVTFSRHGDATIEERVITLAGEGVELPIATDHNIHADYSETAEKIGVAQYFTPVIGNEVTTRKGHFNVFPIEPDSRVPDFRIEHWPALMQSIRGTPGVQVVILNHPRDLHANFRPFAPENFNAVTGENLRGFEFSFDAVELVNSGALQSDLMRLYHDWFALLNYGHKITGIAGSDSHDVSRSIVGQGRTYLAADDSDPANINVDQACQSFLEGRALVSMGLLTLMTVNGQFQPGDLATGIADEINVSLSVLGPSWVEADRLELFANGIKIRETAIEPRSSAGSANATASTKFQANWTIPRPPHDLFLVAIATGPGVQVPFWPIPRPYQATSLEWNPRVIGSTNPIWIDADGDGQFTHARAYAAALVEKHRSIPANLISALARFDEAVARQAAGLCHNAGIDLASKDWQLLLQSAPPQVRNGFTAFLRTLPVE